MLLKIVRSFVVLGLTLAFSESELSAIQVLPRTQSFGEQLGQSFGQAGSNIAQGLAIRRQRELEIARILARIYVLLTGYNFGDHDLYMQRIADSPDLSYSLKMGVISLYNQHKTNHFDLVNKYSKKHDEFVCDVMKSYSGSKNDLKDLSTYITHGTDKNSIMKKVNQLTIDKKQKQRLGRLVDKYHKEKSLMNKKFNENMISLVAAFGG